MLARVPIFAAGWVLAAWLGQQLSPAVPVVLLCGGMILAAVIDGVKFKVPNWLPLSLILGGWGLGCFNSSGLAVGPGPVAPALLMIALRGQLHRNLSNFREIAADFRLLLTAGPKAAAQRAQRRRPTWHRLPYGIPLCIGFVGYLAYLHWFYGG